MRFLLGLIVALSIVILPAAHAGDRGGRFQNLDRMIEELNLRPYFRFSPRKALKVAVFDNGFRGAREAIGSGLPANTEIHNGPVSLPGEEEVHGFYMARIFWSLLSLGGESNRFAPAEFHLYNTYGYSNFEAAVNDAVARGIDIVLYSQTWEYGGNFDGHGFINSLVNKALRHGILWINDAGNFGNTTFNAPVQTGKDDWVKLPGKNSSVEIRCEENPLGKCPFRAVLSWNDFGDTIEKGTDKDLDFVLTDDTLNIIQGSSLTQKKDAADEPGFSKYPREILTTELKPGLYFLRVKNRSRNFSSRDRLRLSVSGDFVKMKGFDTKESVLPPADNPGVITVGAMDSEKSSVSERLHKPELYTNSLVSLSKEENYKGSSNSAAMVAAGAAILFSLDPSLDRASFLKLFRDSRAAGGGGGEGEGLSLQELGFSATTESGCFAPSREELPSFAREMIEKGGVAVDTTLGQKIFFPFDPISLLPGLRRRAENDILTLGANGAGVYARSGVRNMPSTLIELLETPHGQSICSSMGPLPSWSRVFRLPRP